MFVEMIAKATGVNIVFCADTIDFTIGEVMFISFCADVIDLQLENQCSCNVLFILNSCPVGIK